MGPSQPNPITAEHALKAYSYTTDCDSLFYPPLKRFWFMPCLQRVPLWMPANALTVAAFALSVVSFAACIAFVQTPRWPGLLVIAALTLFAYQTLDNVDGPHARRTGTSGPLGELLDHGFDAYTAFFVPLGIGLAYGMPPLLVLLFTSLSAIAFWASMWELQQTGRLATAWISDTEGLFLSALFLLGGGVLGADAMVSPIFGRGTSALDGMMALGIPGFTWQALACLRRVPKERHPFVQAFPVILPQALLVAWYAVSSGAVSTGAIGLLIGVAGARVSVEAILARLYGTPARTFDPLSFAAAGLGLVSALAGGPIGAYQTTLALGASALLTVLLAARCWREAGFIRDVLGIKVFGLNLDA